jgi:hypothetical protein
MAALVSLLYLFACILLLGMAGFVYARNARSPQHRFFALMALSLFAWLLTLYVFHQQEETALLTLWGRLNFASVLLAVLFGLLFVRALTGRALVKASWLWGETLLLTTLTLMTPLVDQMEYRQGSEIITDFGPLFPFYTAHLVLYIGAAVVYVFGSLPTAPRRLRYQLAWVGTGILTSAAVALTTNLLLPYVFGVFAFQEIGALAVLFLIGAIAYAISAYQLFDVRVVIRAAVVFSLLIAFVMELYQAMVTSLTHLLPFHDPAARSLTALFLTITLNVFVQEPLRRTLERLADRVLKRTPHPPKRKAA